MFTPFLNSAKMRKEKCILHKWHSCRILLRILNLLQQKLVSDKQVLACIVKGTTKEFKDYSIDEIIAGIEQEPEVAAREVYPGKSAKKDPGAINWDANSFVVRGDGYRDKETGIRNKLIRNLAKVKMTHRKIKG